MYQRSKQKHKELHSSHGVLENLPSVVFFLIIGGALARLPWRTLVFNLVDESTAAATPAGTSVCAPKTLTVAVLWGLQEHPMQGMKELCLSNTQFILVSCIAQPHSQVKADLNRQDQDNAGSFISGKNILALSFCGLISWETLAFLCTTYSHCEKGSFLSGDLLTGCSLYRMICCHRERNCIPHVSSARYPHIFPNKEYNG